MWNGTRDIEDNFVCRVAVLGDQGVGKTLFMRKLTEGKASDALSSDLETVNCLLKTEDGSEIKT